MSDERPDDQAPPLPDLGTRLALTPAEAARALGIGERLLWEATRRGEPAAGELLAAAEAAGHRDDQAAEIIDKTAAELRSRPRRRLAPHRRHPLRPC